MCNACKIVNKTCIKAKTEFLSCLESSVILAKWFAPFYRVSMFAVFIWTVQREHIVMIDSRNYFFNKMPSKHLEISMGKKKKKTVDLSSLNRKYVTGWQLCIKTYKNTCIICMSVGDWGSVCVWLYVHVHVSMCIACFLSG